MTEQEKEEKRLADEAKKIEEEAKKLSDIEIAELANKALKEKDAELNATRRELAKAKLYSTADDEEVELPSKEDCIKIIGDSRTENYDYAQAVCDLVDIELSEGRPNPLGKNGDEVYNFFKDVIEECGDDKSRFVSIYQSRIGNDPSEIAMAYNKRK